ncbi:hypothetical protein ACFQZQ_13750 [Lysobacter koreensis]|uniref:EF-hand domain-containing protein n=1 Tax=Lysobacter koreensis TaxID=266122 RepID=A0ABW2YS48_9GAMM
MNTTHPSRIPTRRVLLATLLASTIACAIAGIAVAAPQATPGGDHGAGPQRSMMKVDSNNDGVIDRAEAAAHPRLAGKFDALDKNRDGRLDRSERPQWKGKRGHHGGMAGGAQLDGDGDGRISRAEAAGSPRIGEQFAQIDGNRDGYVVRSELHAHHERLRLQRDAERAKRFEEHFTAADLNRDGKLSRLEVGEKMPRLAKSFAFMDEDRDGFLTRADLRHSPRR